MPENKLLDPFTNIPYMEIPSAEENASDEFLNNLRTLNVGDGAEGFRMDKQGIWLGALLFASAPFSVSMVGKLTVSDIYITGGSININDNAIILPTGYATFKGVSALNMKSYTDFEGASRFVIVGDVAPTFANQGMTVAPGTVADHYARALWWITSYVFNNNPTFTCSFLALDGFEVGEGSAFIGLGVPNITGTIFTETGKKICGFHLKKSAGATTITILQCDGSGSLSFANNFGSITVEDGDSIELLLKVNASSIDYYVRKNGGVLSAKATLTGYMPSGAEQFISFYSTNKNSTDDFKVQMQCASYEH